VRFQSDDIVKQFFNSRRTGFYLGVAREGEVGVGDEIKVVSTDPLGVPVSEITRLYAEKRYGDSDIAVVQRALQVPALPESWKEYLRARLERTHGQTP
jgi:MOSC domain-containing protein YiiM